MRVELADLVARRFALLADPMRLRLFDLLEQDREVSVGELADALATTHANASKHLNALLAARVVERRRDGSRALYRSVDPDLTAMCRDSVTSVRRGLRELSERVDAAEDET